ncbi:hypothetical protein AB1I63_09965 [Streptococcus pneumoniae]
MDYSLLPNESIIMQSENVSNGTLFDSELILTNLHLIVIQKGFFGQTKAIKKLPLKQLKLLNNQPQALSVKKGSEKQLEVYFRNGHEVFQFQERRDTDKWAKNICKVYQQDFTDLEQLGHSFIPGMDLLADSVKDTIDTFKNSFGIKDKPMEKTVSVKCSFCGAPLSGLVGQVIACNYCDMEQQL